MASTAYMHSNTKTANKKKNLKNPAVLTILIDSRVFFCDCFCAEHDSLWALGDLKVAKKKKDLSVVQIVVQAKINFNHIHPKSSIDPRAPALILTP